MTYFVYFPETILVKSKCKNVEYKSLYTTLKSLTSVTGCDSSIDSMTCTIRIEAAHIDPCVQHFSFTGSWYFNGHSSSCQLVVKEMCTKYW